MPRLPFIPQEVKFYDLFQQSAQNLVEASKELLVLVEDYDDMEAKVERIRELEHKGDVITHDIIHQLHRTFVTPLDREDISLIAERLDDVMDYIDEAALSMMIYKVRQPSPRAKELAQIIVKGAAEVNTAISLLRQSSHLRQILTHCVEINRLENDADVIYRRSLAELFDEAREDIMEVIKWRDIYLQLETAIDRCEDVANVLEGIVIKNA